MHKTDINKNFSEIQSRQKSSVWIIVQTKNTQKTFLNIDKKVLKTQITQGASFKQRDEVRMFQIYLPNYSKHQKVATRHRTMSSPHFFKECPRQRWRKG